MLSFPFYREKKKRQRKPQRHFHNRMDPQKCWGSGKFFSSSSFWEWSFCSWLSRVLLVTSGHFYRLGSCGLTDLSSLICGDLFFAEYLVSQTYILLKAVLMWRVYANYTSCRFVTRVAPDSSMSYPPATKHSSLTIGTFTQKVTQKYLSTVVHTLPSVQVLTLLNRYFLLHPKWDRAVLYFC